MALNASGTQPHLCQHLTCGSWTNLSPCGPHHQPTPSAHPRDHPQACCCPGRENGESWGLPPAHLCLVGLILQHNLGLRSEEAWDLPPIHLRYLGHSNAVILPASCHKAGGLHRLGFEHQLCCPMIPCWCLSCQLLPPKVGITPQPAS